MSERAENLMHEIAQQLGVPADDSEAFRTISMALRQIADDHVDSGLGLGSADYWLRIGGVEYYLNARRKSPT
jgi:hypothetical protein